VEDVHQGKVGPARLFDSRRELLPLMVSVWPMCVMLSGYFPYKVDY
jgi:hypothetical protein